MANEIASDFTYSIIRFMEVVAVPGSGTNCMKASASNHIERVAATSPGAMEIIYVLPTAAT